MLMIVLAALFIVALTTALMIGLNRRLDALEWLGCIIALGVAVYAIIAYIHQLLFNIDITLGLQEDYIILNDRRLAFGDASHIALVASPTVTGHLRYSVGIQDKTKYNRLLVWWTEKEVADAICHFLLGTGLRIERVESSRDHRPSDLRWGPGLWRKV